MRILVVCHRFPYPPKRGGKIRPFNIIRHLHEQGHEVHVASLTRSQAETDEIDGIAAHCTSYMFEQVNPAAAWLRMLLRLPLLTPSSMGYFYSPQLAKRIMELLASEQFDFVFVQCSSVAQYVAHLTGLAKQLDFGDMDSQKWLLYGKYRKLPFSLGYWWEGKRLEREERRLARQFDLCTCTTRLELETLKSYGAARATGWFPNGVDTDYFAPGEQPYDADLIAFVGRMDYYPNQRGVAFFCHDVLPLIRERRPSVKLQIVGAEPSRAVRRLAKIEGVTVTGSVPDVRPFVRQSLLTIAPLDIARGTQNKILESMAMGVPVVASSVASRGVDAVAGEHLLVADTPEGFRDAVISLSEDAGKRATLAEAGRQRVLDHHNWASSMRALDALLEAHGSGLPPEASNQNR